LNGQNSKTQYDEGTGASSAPVPSVFYHMFKRLRAVRFDCRTEYGDARAAPALRHTPLLCIFNRYRAYCTADRLWTVI